MAAVIYSLEFAYRDHLAEMNELPSIRQINTRRPAGADVTTSFLPL